MMHFLSLEDHRGGMHREESAVQQPSLEYQKMAKKDIKMCICVFAL